MANGQRIRTDKESGKKVDTSAASKLLLRSESTGVGGLKSSKKTTTATMPKDSKKTWTSAELAALQSKAGLVAGAIADFQTAKGMIVRDEVTYTAPSGRVCKAIKLILIVEDMNLVAVKTDDGLDFNLVAVKDE